MSSKKCTGRKKEGEEVPSWHPLGRACFHSPQSSYCGLLYIGMGVGVFGPFAHPVCVCRQLRTEFLDVHGFGIGEALFVDASVLARRCFCFYPMGTGEDGALWTLIVGGLCCLEWIGFLGMSGAGMASLCLGCHCCWVVTL